MREEFVVGKTTEKKQLRALCKGNSKETPRKRNSTESLLKCNSIENTEKKLRQTVSLKLKKGNFSLWKSNEVFNRSTTRTQLTTRVNQVNNQTNCLSFPNCTPRFSKKFLYPVKFSGGNR